MSEEPDISSTTDRVRQLLSRILESATFPGSQELRAQIPFVKVIGGPITMLDLTVEAAPPSAARKGPIPIRAFVRRGSGEATGELLVWVENGHLCGLEFAWLTDEQPATLPSPDDIQIERSPT